MGAGGSDPSRRHQSVRLDLGEGCGGRLQPTGRQLLTGSRVWGLAPGSVYIPPGRALGDARARQEATADQSRQLGVRQIQAVPLDTHVSGL